jgi:hypothetical protein
MVPCNEIDFRYPSALYGPEWAIDILEKQGSYKRFLKKLDEACKCHKYGG